MLLIKQIIQTYFDWIKVRLIDFFAHGMTLCIVRGEEIRDIFLSIHEATYCSLLPFFNEKLSTLIVKIKGT